MEKIIERVAYRDVIQREHQILSETMGNALDEALGRLPSKFYGAKLYFKLKSTLGVGTFLDVFELKCKGKVILRVKIRKDEGNITNRAVAAKIICGMGQEGIDLMSSHTTLGSMLDEFAIKKGLFGTTFTYKKFDNADLYSHRVVEACVRYSILVQLKAYHPEIKQIARVGGLDNPVMHMILKTDTLDRGTRKLANKTKFDLKDRVPIPVDCELETFIPRAIEKFQEACEAATKIYEESHTNLGYKVSLYSEKCPGRVVELYAHQSKKPVVDANLWIHYICPGTGNTVMENIKKYNRVVIQER